MELLININNQDGKLTVSSREVASNFSRRHSDVLQKIDSLSLEMDSTEKSVQYFIPNEYKDESGKSNKEYLLTRDGFSLLVMGFTGSKALEWKLKYIEAFNQMESEIRTSYPKLSKELQAILMIDQKQQVIESKIEAINTDLQDFKMDMPILGIECERITSAVRRKSVECLGGKKSKAYQDKSLNHKIYSDIYKQLKREFDVTSYKAIKRSQSDLAIGIINAYKLPLALAEQVCELNQQLQIG